MPPGPSTTARRSSTSVRTVSKAALAVGFLAVAVTLVAARRLPAVGYELSIYDATPLVVWVAVGAALGIATLVALAPASARVRNVSLVLGGATVVAVALLPFVRNYAFHGAGDALTHLGWTRGIVDGTFEPLSLFYPTIHLIAAELHAVTGLDETRALMLVVVYALTVFLLFVPLTVRTLTDRGLPVALAAVTTWLVLPVDHIGVILQAYPTAQALFFLPLVLFALVCYLRRPVDAGERAFGLNPFGVLLAAGSVGMVLLHPQQAVNVLILLGVAASMQFLVRRWAPDRPAAEHRTLYAQTVFLAVVFSVWTIRRERFRGAFRGALNSAFVPGRGSLSAIGQRGTSLAELGGGLADLFLRLYLPEAAFSLLVAGLVLAVWRRRAGLTPDVRAVVAYFVAALVPLTLLFGFYFVATPVISFRQVGLLLVFASVLAPLALAAADGALASLASPRVGRTVIALVLVAALVLSTPTFFASPFMYKSTGHVSQQQFDGHAFALSHRGDGTPYTRLMLSAEMSRYGDALFGVPASDDIDYAATGETTVPPPAFNRGRLAAAYNGTTYLKLSRADYEREVHMYDEFRYRQRGFEAVDDQPRVDKVQTNGVFRLYVINGTRSDGTR
jgi:hypothetical protein